MSPTTEPPENRVFHFLLKDGIERDIPADTVCDRTGHGTSFRLKRGGKVVGELEGDVAAWWIEE